MITPFVKLRIVIDLSYDKSYRLEETSDTVFFLPILRKYIRRMQTKHFPFVCIQLSDKFFLFFDKIDFVTDFFVSEL